MRSIEDRKETESAGVLTAWHAEKEKLPDRRAVVRGGIKLAFAAPILSTFFASQAYAGNYSCYALGHQCVDGGPNAEPCCAALTCQADGGSPTGFSCQP